MSVSRETLIEGVSRETLERLSIFQTLLLRWNGRINLISKADETQVRSRHIADSLQLIALFPHTPTPLTAIDLGSGGGFPGLVLAIATGIHFDLVEADQRKAAFLREAARETWATASIHACRIEDSEIPPAPLITARALAPLAKLLPLAHQFMTESSIALFPKGETVDKELTEAADAWNMKIERYASRVDRGGVILRISEVKRVG
jgi:16S rRNA (guanine527-N7)-methyltransferase